MNVVVVIRLMPELGDALELDANGADIDRETVGMTINEIDDQALEEAVLIKEATGATVSAVALRVEGIEAALRVAFARGADRTLIVEAGDLDPYDSRGAALALAEAIRRLAPDLVLTGVQTPYDVFGQLTPLLGAALGWPHVSVVSNVRLIEGTVRLVQEYSGGREAVLEVELPAVLGVQAASAPPRYVSITRLRRAMMAAVINTMSVAVETPPLGTTLVSLAPSERRTGATMLHGEAHEVAAQIAALFHERGILEG